MNVCRLFPGELQVVGVTERRLHPAGRVQSDVPAGGPAGPTGTTALRTHWRNEQWTNKRDDGGRGWEAKQTLNIKKLIKNTT